MFPITLPNSYYVNDLRDDSYEVFRTCFLIAQSWTIVYDFDHIQTKNQTICFNLKDVRFEGAIMQDGVGYSLKYRMSRKYITCHPYSVYFRSGIEV